MDLPHSERARFEAWADSQSGGIGRTWRSTEPGYTDTYGDSHTQIAWRTWQEAVRQERAAILEAIDDIEEKPWYGYENPNTFQDAKWAAMDVVRSRSEEVKG